ncbi:MAG TPA: ATP synthase F1 subunit gamma [Candidatus Binatia bacterium]|nr:ATP synthase F1 subunit gamma [Candidatus Binatia bacterium]
MASLKAIRKRIGTVRSTQQITKAMKMVAAAKLRRAQEAAVASRPYAQKLEAMVAHLASRVDPGSHPLLRVPEGEHRLLLIVITGDRGLCGGYNANLGRTTENFLRERTEGGALSRLTAIGRKGNDYLKRRGFPPDTRFPMPVAADAAPIARELARVATQAFIEDEVDAVYLVYSHFRSALSQVPTIERLLPFERLAAADGDAAAPHADYLFEPDPQTIMAFVLPRLVEVRILHGLLEAGASEQGARMTAMDSATRNASEMIDRLTLEMNRARQAAITKELMEIIGGAEALKG